MKRGRILRDPSQGPGLVTVESRQYRFPLEGIWRSETLPRPGQLVEVEFDACGEVCGMAAVPERQLAIPRLLAFALLSIGWCAVDIVQLDRGFVGPQALTLWELLADLPGANLYRTGTVLCLAGSLLPHFWRDARAHLADFTPLMLMAIVVMQVTGHLQPQPLPASLLESGLIPGASAALLLAAMGARALPRRA